MANILVVDDEHGIRELLFEILDDEGSQFIDGILKFRDNPKILAAIVIARLDETVEEVISCCETLEMDLADEMAENLRTHH